MTTGEQGTVGTGDSSMRGVAEAGVEKGRRKGCEVGVGWGTCTRAEREARLPAHVFSSQRQTSGRPSVLTSTKLRRNGWRRRYSPCNSQQSPSFPDERNT